MLGNCAIGRLTIEAMPTSTITIAMTIATIGRLMKKRYIPWLRRHVVVQYQAAHLVYCGQPFRAEASNAWRFLYFRAKRLNQQTFWRVVQCVSMQLPGGLLHEWLWRNRRTLFHFLGAFDNYLFPGL